MKKAFKAAVVATLGWQVRRLRRKHKFNLIAVAGSIGKTSTKMAIAEVLSASQRVQYHEGNYNDITTVPLIFFGQKQPSLTNPLAWLRVFFANEKKIKSFDYETVVVEIGTDAPGQIDAFKKYLDPDLTVITAITPEHMENFADLDVVAREELAVAGYSKRLLVNTDLSPEKYLANINVELLTYGTKNADFKIENVQFSANGCSFKITKKGKEIIKVDHASFSEPQLYSLAAAITVANIYGLSVDQIRKGLGVIMPVAGRMQKLEGIKNSVIIDDSYNASPEATRAALNTLIRLSAQQKIALLGNMNELGKFSSNAHTEIGEMCKPENLDLVVTLGPEANEYLAVAAQKNGCRVIKTNSPYEAGQVVKENIKDNATVLVKGSQNGVFAEEAIKAFLKNPEDEAKLVRQSAAWMKVKNKQFNRGN